MTTHKLAERFHPVSGALMHQRLYRCPAIHCGSGRVYWMTDHQFGAQKIAPHDCPMHKHRYRQSRSATLAYIAEGAA